MYCAIQFYLLAKVVVIIRYAAPLENRRLTDKGTSDQFMDSYLVAKISSFRVANLANSQLFAAIRALNLNILTHKLLRPELIRGSLK